MAKTNVTRWTDSKVKLLDGWINYGEIIAKMGRQLKEHGHTACEFPARSSTRPTIQYK